MYTLVINNKGKIKFKLNKSESHVTSVLLKIISSHIGDPKLSELKLVPMRRRIKSILDCIEGKSTKYEVPQITILQCDSQSNECIHLVSIESFLDDLTELSLEYI